MHQQAESALRSLVGACTAMRELRSEIAALAPLDTSVLILGETGTGKGIAARALHALSPRCAGPFVHADCASLPRTLFESELFGHERGAFTGALARRAGRFERAAGGSLFLDEIGELEPSLQAALLHVLQERSYERVGGAAPLSLCARVIAATSRDLRAEVRAGRFRADLYFRLDVARLRLPPLRERAGDVPLLAHALLERALRRLPLPPPRLSEGALAALQAHDWPGNVRELRNAIENMVLLARGEVLAPEDVPETVQSSGGDGRRSGGYELAGRSMAEVERALIQANLELAEGNREKAAKILGIGERTLYRKLKEYGLS